MWLREIARNPLSVEEIEEREKGNLSEKGDAAIAVSPEPDRTPTWWARHHPIISQKLSQAEWSRWATGVLADELSRSKRTPRPRRET
jgi:hypothetical protein